MHVEQRGRGKVIPTNATVWVEERYLIVSSHVLDSGPCSDEQAAYVIRIMQ